MGRFAKLITNCSPAPLPPSNVVTMLSLSTVRMISVAFNIVWGEGAFQKLQRQLNKNVEDRLKIWRMKMFTDNAILCCCPGNFWPGLSEKVVLQKTRYIFRKDKYFMRFIACT